MGHPVYPSPPAFELTLSRRPDLILGKAIVSGSRFQGCRPSCLAFLQGPTQASCGACCSLFGTPTADLCLSCMCRRLKDGVQRTTCPSILNTSWLKTCVAARLVRSSHATTAKRPPRTFFLWEGARPVIVMKCFRLAFREVRVSQARNGPLSRHGLDWWPVPMDSVHRIPSS